MTTVTVYVNGLPEEFPAHYHIRDAYDYFPAILTPDYNERWRFERDMSGKWYAYQTQASRSSIPHSYRGEGINDIG